MSITPVLVVTLLLSWAYWLWSRRRYYAIHAKLPGPLGLPFLGIGLQMIQTDRFLQTFEKMSKEYKTPFITWMGTDCWLYVSDPETIETIFQSPSCTNKGYIYRFMNAVIGDGLFTSSSPRWNKHRRLLNPAFGRKTVASFLPIFNQESNVMVNRLATTSDESLELYELLKKCILEISCQTTMGQKMNFQDDGSAEIFNSYTSLLEICMKRMLSPWLYSDVVYRYTGIMKYQQQYVDILLNFIDTLLGRKEGSTMKPEKRPLSTEKPVSSVASYENNEYEDEGIKKSKSKVFIECVRSYIQEGKLTIEEVRDEANVIMAAAFETTATALYFVCLCLAMHPEHQDKLYNELVDLFPNNSKKLNLSEVTNEHLEHMTYTEMVINEAMRLFSPVPMVLRSASSDFHLSDGTVVPRGTQLAIDIFNMQRNEQFWGPYARTFDPERHFGGTNQEQHPFAFVPFTKGLRMCIGYRYALLLMKLVVAKIFRNFRVHTDAKLADLVVKGTISLKLSHNYPLCKFQPREDIS